MFLGGINSAVSTILWTLLSVDVNDNSRGPGVCRLGTKVSAGLAKALSTKPSFLLALSFSQMKAPEGSTFISGRGGQPTVMEHVMDLTIEDN